MSYHFEYLYTFIPLYLGALIPPRAIAIKCLTLKRLRNSRNPAYGIWNLSLLIAFLPAILGFTIYFTRAGLMNRDKEGRLVSY